MIVPTVFITGTDTGIGKTRASTSLVRLLRTRGIDAVGFKPVAAGCEATADGWRNDDALQLLAASEGVEPYEAINPIALPAAIAPHLAAHDVAAPIALATLDAAYEALHSRHQCVIVEGAGGWRVPLNAQADFADWVASRHWPVVLVVGLRLGCLNHALLSAESIARRAPLIGWIANVLPPRQPRWQDNLQTLRERLPVPCLGVLAEHGDERANMRALDTPETRAVLGG